MGSLHHISDEPEHSLRYHSVLHRLQAVPGQGDERDSVQELSAKCETEEQAHTHGQRPINEQPDQRNDMKQPSFPCQTARQYVLCTLWNNVTLNASLCTWFIIKRIKTSN